MTPESLALLVEEKARQVVAEQRSHDAKEAEAAKQARVDRAMRQELDTARASLSEMEQKLARARAERPPYASFSKGVGVLAVLLGLIVGGISFPACIEPMAGRSLVAGTLFCPSVCDGCHGPGRIFTWHETVNGNDENPSVQLCHNPHVDLNAITTSDVVARVEKDLAPYTLTLWSSVPVDAPLGVLEMLVVLPLVAAWFRRRGVARERVLYAEAVERLKKDIRGHEATLAARGVATSS
jgi:hypothetical protein